MRGKQLLFFVTLLCLFSTSNMYAALQSGTAAVDFTLTDINGKSFNLNALNAQGKNVILNFSSSWSPSSWAYEQKNILNNINEQFGENGTMDVVVLFIETDPSTNLSCLKGEGDCNSSFMGDWTSHINYAIIDLSADQLWIESLYQVTEYPTLYGVSKNGLVENMGQAKESAWLEWMFGESKFQVNLDVKVETKAKSTFSFLNLISSSDEQIIDSKPIEALPILASNLTSNKVITIADLDVDSSLDEDTFDTDVQLVNHESEMDQFIASLGQNKLMFKDFNLIL